MASAVDRTAASASAKASRNQVVLREVMTEMTKEDKGSLVEISIKSQPDNDVTFVDWFILVIIISKVVGSVENLRDIGNRNGDLETYSNGYVELSHQGVRFRYKTDEDGRITELIIGCNFNEDIDSDSEEENAIRSYHLPVEVARLDKLTNLEVVNCRSLPLELSCLPELYRLEFCRCSDLVNSFPIQMNLPHCEYLIVTDCCQLQ